MSCTVTVSAQSAKPERPDIELITEGDVVGMGRIVVNGKFFALPVSAIEAIQSWRDREND